MKQKSQSKHRKAKSKQPNSTMVPPLTDTLSGPSGSGDQGSGPSVISALQEFVQDSKEFRMPTRHSVLQWNFEERSINGLSIHFCATAAFVLEGVPHHVAGDWQTSKNHAKRDAAERALELFVSQWGWQLLQDMQVSTSDIIQDSSNSRQDDKINGQENVEDVDTLINFCMHFPPCCQMLPELSVTSEADSVKGFAQINLFGVPHTFAGNACNNEDVARADVARRVLWYLQCPGFDDRFQVDLEALADLQAIEEPPPHWAGDGGL